MIPRRVLRVMVPAILAAGCSDFGNDGVQPVDSPTITDLVPMRTFPGDTVLVQGAGFGAEPGEVLFASSALRAADASATILSWEDTRVRALVPGDVVTGDLTIRADGVESNALTFGVAPEISFSGDVVPRFVTYGCTGCHAFPTVSGGLEVLPHAALVGNSAVIPRRSSSSRLRQRLLPTTPASQRMPEGGPYLSEAEILVIADWIDQGARDN